MFCGHYPGNLGCSHDVPVLSHAPDQRLTRKGQGQRLRVRCGRDPRPFLAPTSRRRVLQSCWKLSLPTYSGRKAVFLSSIRKSLRRSTSAFSMVRSFDVSVSQIVVKLCPTMTIVLWSNIITPWDPEEIKREGRKNRAVRVTNSNLACEVSPSAAMSSFTGKSRKASRSFACFTAPATWTPSSTRTIGL
jgi:hypothetical protein